LSEKQSTGITISEMSDRIGVSNRAIEKQISHLKQGGSIARVGSNRNGEWVILA